MAAYTGIYMHACTTHIHTPAHTGTHEMLKESACSGRSCRWRGSLDRVGPRAQEPQLPATSLSLEWAMVLTVTYSHCHR